MLEPFSSGDISPKAPIEIDSISGICDASLNPTNELRRQSVAPSTFKMKFQLTDLKAFIISALIIHTPRSNAPPVISFDELICKEDIIPYAATLHKSTMTRSDQLRKDNLQ